MCQALIGDPLLIVYPRLLVTKGSHIDIFVGQSFGPMRRPQNDRRIIALIFGQTLIMIPVPKDTGREEECDPRWTTRDGGFGLCTALPPRSDENGRSAFLLTC